MRSPGYLMAVVWVLAAALVCGCKTVAKPAAKAGPWNLTALFEPPPVEWGATKGRSQELYYSGEPLAGQPSRVFAYLARPADLGRGKAPAMVLVHGGGGKAFRDWAEHWAGRGYVALAMDLAGNGPAGRLADGGPDQSDAVKFGELTRETVGEAWSYHAVAAVIRGHSLLRSLPEVDPRRVGITGISWGGYLTCMVAGLDSRLKVAVPVYGCGFLGENSYWKERSLAAMTPDARQLWLKTFDPSVYLPGVQCPILFVNGTTDFAYPLDSYQKSYRLVPEPLRTVCVVTNLPHGHIWTFPEVDTFVDRELRGGVSLPRLGPTVLEGSTLTAEMRSPLPITEAWLCYTQDAGPWDKRVWKAMPALAEGRRVRASFPGQGARVVFLAVRDSRGLRGSSEHLELPTD